MEKKSKKLRLFTDLIFKEGTPFTKKREINKDRLAKVFYYSLGAIVITLLFYPFKPEQKKEIQNEKTPFQNPPPPNQNMSDADAQALAAMQSSNAQGSGSKARAQVGGGSIGGMFGGGFSSSKNTSMIIMRGLSDSKTSLQPGTRLQLRLTDSITVSSQSVPINAVLVRDVPHDDLIAIPEGAKFTGSVTFDDSSDRATITLNTIIFPNGESKPISAMGAGMDGSIGVEGDVHSKALANTVGQTMTRFIGSFASGSVSHGMLGSSDGGYSNGLKTAISDTAQDRANQMGEELKKEKKWIELKSGQSFVAIISQPFQFAHAGGANGN